MFFKKFQATKIVHKHRSDMNTKNEKEKSGNKCMSQYEYRVRYESRGCVNISSTRHCDLGQASMRLCQDLRSVLLYCLTSI